MGRGADLRGWQGCRGRLWAGRNSRTSALGKRMGRAAALGRCTQGAGAGQQQAGISMQVQPCSTLCTTLCRMQHVDRRSDRHGNLDADNL